jgi:hypothetical protein
MGVVFCLRAHCGLNLGGLVTGVLTAVISRSCLVPAATNEEEVNLDFFLSCFSAFATVRNSGKLDQLYRYIEEHTLRRVDLLLTALTLITRRT